MATIIGLPKLSPTMEEGVLAKWSRKEGDKVAPGDVIAEVETDKANMDFTLEDEGTLLKLLVKEGDTVKLGSPVAILGNPGEDIGGLEKQARAQMAGGGGDATAAPAPKTEATALPVGGEASVKPKDVPPPVPASPPQQRVAGPTAPTLVVQTIRDNPAQAAAASAGPGGARLLASPMAKTLAAENGIDLRSLKGSGPGGRIVERDVLAAVGGGGGGNGATQAASPAVAKPAAAAAAAAPTPAARPAPAPSGQDVDKPLSMMRKTIAKRLVEAKTTIPHFYLTGDCDAAPLLAFRTTLNEIVGEDAKISVNDLIVKAAAVTLRRLPAVNAAFLGDKIRYFAGVHVGVAVSVEDGLITPVVRDTDRKGLSAISAEIKDLATRARAKKLTPEEMTGSTFTVSNLGMYGLDHFQAIINPPEAVILAVGAVRKQPVVGADGQIVAGQRMALTLSCDHRVVDGALGARYLAELVKVLEQPASLAL